MRREARSLSKAVISILQRQYESEKKLADKLLRSTQEERKFLYREIYDCLYKEYPHLTPVKRKIDTKAQSRSVSSQMRYLNPFLRRDASFLEIGAGDCSLAIHVARICKEVFAVDVSEEVVKRTDGTAVPSNLRLLISNGIDIPLPANSITIAYSSQLIEHLHPDDVLDLLKNIIEILAPGGMYICLTPNRLSGPHDISKYFEETATGLHLKEYTYKELTGLFKKIGFSEVNALMITRIKHSPFLSPVFPFNQIENFLALFPKRMSKKMASSRLGPFSINQIRLVARK